MKDRRKEEVKKITKTIVLCKERNKRWISERNIEGKNEWGRVKVWKNKLSLRLSAWNIAGKKI